MASVLIPQRHHTPLEIKQSLAVMHAIDDIAVRERVADALKDAGIGPRKNYNYETAAEYLGDNYYNVKGWTLGQVIPSLIKFLRLAALLGPDFVNPVLRIAGMDGARRVAMLEGNPFVLASEMAGAVSTITAALRDGRVDHTEMPAVLRELKDATRLAEEFIAKAEATPDKD